MCLILVLKELSFGWLCDDQDQLITLLNPVFYNEKANTDSQMPSKSKANERKDLACNEIKLYPF